MENPNFKAQETQQQDHAPGQGGAAPPPAGFGSYASPPPPYPTDPPTYCPPTQPCGPPPPHPTITTIYGNNHHATFAPQTIQIQPTSTTGQHGTTTIIVTPVVGLGSEPVRTTCPHCGADITTRVTYETGMMTHICCLVICCFLCWPCACIPYLTDCAKDASHYCPHCKHHIGTYKR